MSDFKDYFCLGKITKTFGYKGDAVIYIDSDEPKKYKKLESVLFEINGELVPFSINKFTFKSDNQAIVHFIGIDGDEIIKYINTNLYLPLTSLPPLTGNKFYYHEVIGFKVIDSVYGIIGHVDSFYDNLNQPIMSILNGQREILLPLIDHFIIEVDRENKIIKVETPPGLVELYLK